jgi:hypothetical protein
MSAATVAGMMTWRPGRAAALAREERTLAAFDSVLWEAAGELIVTQGDREHLTLEAEPAVLAKIVAEVKGRSLYLGYTGSVQTRQPVRFRLELKTLTALTTRGSGTLRIGALVTPALSLRLGGSEELRLASLQARTLDVNIDGSGDLTIAGGAVDRQQVMLAGSGRYNALALASRQADVAIDGSGELRVAVSELLGARIAGSGEVLYRGKPRVMRSVTGSGEIRPVGDERS